MTEARVGKLVRDKIPDLIRADGGEPVVEILNGQDLVFALKDKVVEEAQEVREAESRKDLIEEIGDAYESLDALAREAGISQSEIRIARERKAAEKGVFNEGLYLESVSEK